MKYCWAPGCKESNSEKTNVSFHGFPTDFKQRQIWIQATGRSCEPGKTAVICSKHFRAEDFETTTKLARLKRDAVPSQFNEATAEEQSKQVVQESQCSTGGPTCKRGIAEAAFQSSDCDSDSSDGSLSPKNSSLLNESNVEELSLGSRKRKWQPAHTKQVTSDHLSTPRRRMKYWSQAVDEINHLRKKVKALQEDKRRMNKKIETLNDMMKDLETKRLLTENASDTIMRSMPKLQTDLFAKIQRSKSRKKFQPELRSFALTLQFYSSKAYDYVREVFNGALPHPTTLRRWYQHVDGSPGFTTEAFEALKVTVAENNNINKKTYCCLMVDEMAIRLAAQTFSNSVADALNWLEFDLQDPKFQGAAATATFCRNMNAVFDLLNSRNQFVKDLSKVPVSSTNIHLIKDKVARLTEYICSLQVIADHRHGLQRITTSGRRVGFIGMILSMAATLNIAKHLIEKEDSGMKYLLTYKISQDHLETFFSAVRRQGGFNNNPSAYQLQSIYKRLLVHHEITGSQYANCIAMDSTRILHLGSRTITAGRTAELSTDIIDSNFAQDNVIADHDYADAPRYCLSAYVNDVVAYIAGFVVRKVKKTVQCHDCCAILKMDSSDESTSLLLERKNRGKLTRPIADIVNLCQLAEQVFRGTSGPNENANYNLQPRLIIATLRRLPSDIFAILDDHIKEQEPLNDHKYQLIKLILSIYFKIRIHHHSTATQKNVTRIRKQQGKEILFRHQ